VLDGSGRDRHSLHFFVQTSWAETNEPVHTQGASPANFIWNGQNNTRPGSTTRQLKGGTGPGLPPYAPERMLDPATLRREKARGQPNAFALFHGNHPSTLRWGQHGRRGDFQRAPVVRWWGHGNPIAGQPGYDEPGPTRFTSAWARNRDVGAPR